MERKSHLVMFILMLMLWTGVAGYFLAHEQRELQRQRATANWEPTWGTLIAKEVGTDAEGWVEVALRYSYRVNGQEFEGDRVAFHALASEKQAAVRGVEEGSALTIYYDPADPSQSSLTHGLSSDAHSLSWLIIAGFAVLTGLGWLAAAGGVARAMRRGGPR